MQEAMWGHMGAMGAMLGARGCHVEGPWRGAAVLSPAEASLWVFHAGIRPVSEGASGDGGPGPMSHTTNLSLPS